MPGSNLSEWREISDAINVVSEQRQREVVLEGISPPQSQIPMTLPPPYLSAVATSSLVIQAWGRTLQQIKAAQAALRMLEEVYLIQTTCSSSGVLSDGRGSIERVSEVLRETRESVDFFR